ncbi:MAG: AAA family ATPase [Lewinella sp.]|uniref:AAA family ATPase n=1 Tax=Lewinella sp. TaxID=2004506 RepID=UPI003D6A26D9
MDQNAINNLREALAHSPDNIPLRLHLAQSLAQLFQYQEAEQEFKAVLRLSPQHKDAKFGLAKAYFHQEKYGVTIVVIEELLHLDPDAENYKLLLCRAYLRNDNKAEAQQAFQELVRANPTLRDEELDQAFRNFHFDASADADDGIDEDALRSSRPGINFKHVGGMDRVKDEISLKIIKPLEHKELYAAYGKKIGGGILMYGPPGCGKTHLARATAGEINAEFISVGISDILDMWIGSSEKNLHQLFEQARAKAPCVLFFDEVDALGASRSDMRQSAGRQLINQFLSELDGVDANNDGLLVIGATNAPWHMDPAFRRPGRFDRILFVEPPDQKGREAILQIMLAGKPLGKVDLSSVAKKTEGFSGADLQAVIDRCIEDKLKASFSTGIPDPIATKDLLKAAKVHKATTREWFNTARNYALYANESGLYDDILSYLKVKK